MWYPRGENNLPTEGFGPSVTRGWAAQPECERSAAMIRRTLGQYIAAFPRLQLTSHTQLTSTLSRIKCERYIFIKIRVRSFIEVVIMFDYVSAHIWMYMSIQQFDFSFFLIDNVLQRWNLLMQKTLNESRPCSLTIYQNKSFCSTLPNRILS